MSRKVLIVEDDPNIARLVRMHVEDAGFEAELAPTGEAGLAAVGRGGVGLVVLDRMLPGIDGLEVCRRSPSGLRYIFLQCHIRSLGRCAGVQSYELW